MPRLEDIQLPPNSYELELESLKRAFTDITILEGLDEHCYYSESNKRLFKAIKKIGKMDTPLLAIESGWTEEQISDIFFTLGNSGNEYIVTELQKYKNARILLRGVRQLELKIRGLEYPSVRDVLSKMQNLSQDIEGDKNIQELAVEYFDDISKIKKSLSTGFTLLDDVISLTGGQLIVVAGRPGLGKTTFMQNMCIRQSGLFNVGFVSMEMKVFELIDRFICMIGGITSQEMKDKHLIIDPISNHLSNLIEKSLFITESCYTLDRVEQYIVKNKLDICHIDYLGLMQYGPANMPPIQRISEITRQLKLMAKKHDCCIILGSQLSRGVESRVDKRPLLADLRDSGSIEQDADIVIMLYREEYYDDETELKGILDAIVRKNRNGEIKQISLSSNFSIYRVSDAGSTKSI